MINSFIEKPLNKFLLWLLCGIVVCLVGINNVFAIETTYSTKYYWCTTNGSTDNCTSTSYRSDDNNSVLLNGSSAWQMGQYWESFTGFYNNVSYSLTKDSSYVVTVVLQMTNIATNEFGSANLPRLNTYKQFSAGTISSVNYSYKKVQSGQQDYYDYTITINYVITASSNTSSFYIGSYNSSGYTIALNSHYLTSIVSVQSVSVVLNNDNTIINQNETIINQNQDIINNIDTTNENLEDIKDTLTDNSEATFDSSYINITPNAPITNLLTIPITLLQSILTRLNNSCTPITLPFLFNTDITFPCFNISDYLGSVSNTIDLCICFVMIYNIFMLFVSVFEDITTLRDGFLSLYEPKHAYTGYHPKHGKE